MHGAQNPLVAVVGVYPALLAALPFTLDRYGQFSLLVDFLVEIALPVVLDTENELHFVDESIAGLVEVELELIQQQLDELINVFLLLESDK